MNRERKVYIRLFSFSLFGFILFSWSSTLFACEIIIKNDTGVELTIARLDDMCGNIVVGFRKQHVLKPNEETCFKDLKPVMHHYQICANGTCDISSMGMDSKTKTYMIRVIINGRYVWGIVTPKIWPGNNKCDEELDKSNKLLAIKVE